MSSVETKQKLRKIEKKEFKSYYKSIYFAGGLIVFRTVLMTLLMKGTITWVLSVWRDKSKMFAKYWSEFHNLKCHKGQKVK